jgi:hypothetical protein
LSLLIITLYDFYWEQEEGMTAGSTVAIRERKTMRNDSTGTSPKGDVYPNTSQEADGIVVGARSRMAIGVSPL